MKNNLAEKRAAQRLRINYLMRYCKENSVARFHAFFNDISEKGLKFLSKEYLPHLTPVSIELPYDSQLIELNGRIVWNNALASNFYEVGVSFEGLVPEKRAILVKYIQELKGKLGE